MVSPITIEKVRAAADLYAIISEVVALKDKGVNYLGLCPFHNEHTPSFNVSKTKHYYKCFGCGKSGDVINFFSEYHKVSFIDTIEQLANRYAIPMEWDKTYTKEEIQDRKNKKEQTALMFTYSHNKYMRNLLESPKDSVIWQWLGSRGITEDMAIKQGYGYAPESRQFLSTSLIERGWYNIGKEYGLLNSKNEYNYDVYSNRLIIPSYDRYGKLNGFIGRIVGDGKPKYINPPASDLYNKSQELYNLSKAIPSIKETSFLYLVEGNLDADALYYYGIENVVATGGTALTPEQVSSISQIVNRVVLMRDGDDAGITAMEKEIDMLVSRNIHTELIELPWGEDPNSYLIKEVYKSQLQTAAT